MHPESDVALAASPNKIIKQAIDDACAEIRAKDLAPARSKWCHERQVKNEMKALTASMPTKLIAKQRAARGAKERRAVQLEQMARAGTLQFPARV